MNLYDENGNKLTLYKINTPIGVLVSYGSGEIDVLELERKISEFNDWSWDKKCKTSIFDILTHALLVIKNYGLTGIECKTITVE